jgi:hypothetical protein
MNDINPTEGISRIRWSLVKTINKGGESKKSVKVEATETNRFDFMFS